MRRNTLRANKRVLIIVISSIAAAVIIAAGLTYAWISGAFNYIGAWTKNPITSIEIGNDGVITGTLSLNQSEIKTAIAFTNNSGFDVQIEEVMVSITFYESETQYNAGRTSPDISLVYTSGSTTKYHVTPTVASGWTATANTDNIKYTTTDNVISNEGTKNFISKFALSDITASYGFATGTFYEIVISITTSPVVPTV